MNLPASTPEPDNVLYGHVVFEDAPALAPNLIGVEVQARAMSGDEAPEEVLATYTIGDIDRADANQFVLKIKVDAAPASRPRALEDGDAFALFIDGYQVSGMIAAGGIGDSSTLFREIDITLEPELKATSGDIIAHILGMIPLSGVKLATSDTNGDGVIDLADFLVLEASKTSEPTIGKQSSNAPVS